MPAPSTAELGFVHRFVAGEGPHADVTLLLLHGTGGDESDLLPLGRALLPGAALLSPRGQVLEHGMPRFFRRVAEGVFDEADLIARTHDLARFVERAAAQYGRDPSRIIAVGFSNGANIAASTLLLYPDLLRAAILLRPMVPFEPNAPPRIPETPVLIEAGRFDPLVPADNTERLAELLRASGAAVTVQYAPAAHALSPGEVETARRWLADVVTSMSPGERGAS
ncbi:MAG TPA: alpha/beta hydrolase [Gemmatimonadaceae bacterium]